MLLFLREGMVFIYFDLGLFMVPNVIIFAPFFGGATDVEDCSDCSEIVPAASLLLQTFS